MFNVRVRSELEDDFLEIKHTGKFFRVNELLTIEIDDFLHDILCISIDNLIRRYIRFIVISIEGIAKHEGVVYHRHILLDLHRQALNCRNWACFRLKEC